MNWVRISERLPREFEEVILYDGEVFWVGFYQKCRTECIQNVIIWWASNPNKITLGHSPFLAHEPTHWVHILQPERLNPETANEWIDWEKFPPPKDVKGLFILFENKKVWTDAEFYGSEEYKLKTVGNAKPIGWKFIERSDPNKKFIKADAIV